MGVVERVLDADRLRLVDVGARDGIDPRWRRFAEVIDVTAFEPDEAECERLEARAAALPYPARFLPHALWREVDDVQFHVANWPVASSIFPPNEEFLRSFPVARGLLATREVRTIATTTLDRVSDQRGFGCDVLKLDVEGAELDVLRGGEAVLAGALALEVEVELNPLFEGQPLFAEVDAHLRERGWALQGLRRTSWRRGPALEAAESGDGGQIVAADALYLSGAAAGELGLGRELKLLVAMSAYRQADFVLARIRGSRALAAELTAAELGELEAALAPRPSAAERSQPGDATVWQDGEFF
jgi:FkbM family methyltransferase